jgi:thiamine-monophosphate kinase
VESDFVEWLLAGLACDDRLEVPAGDDAAVVRPPAGRRTVVTVDMLMEGVDFLLLPSPTGCSPEAVGRKALGVNLSDLAAMAATPEVAVVAVALPRHHGSEIARGLHAGIATMAAEHGVALAGGDTNAWDGPLVVSITALGSVSPGRAWRRDGARPGDLIVATGAFGGSLLGRHLAVEPRCREALHIADHHTVHAAIDVSDGLSLDLARLMDASKTAAIVDLDRVPLHPDARRASDLDGRSPLDHALADGEDFELLLAMPAAAARELVAVAGRPPLTLPLTVIAEVVDGRGLLARDSEGGVHPLPARGYLHHFDP